MTLLSSWTNEDEAWPPSTMSLKTLKNTQGFNNRPFLRETNDISDIDGARPASRWIRKNKPNLYNTLDIEGAAPKPQHVKLRNKPNSFLTMDIEYAQPKVKLFRTNRVVDPLDPTYNLPKYETPESPTPKFLRDTMDWSDVEGTSSFNWLKWKQRDFHNVHDIEGATSSWKPRHQQREHGTIRNYMDISDIVSRDEKPKRKVDPLNPVYSINGMTHGEIPKTRPRQLPKASKEPFRSLMTKDIVGARSDSSFPKMRKALSRPKHLLKDNNRTEDIEGARADTLKRGLSTKRIVNPLTPTYRNLDGFLESTPSKWPPSPNQMESDIELNDRRPSTSAAAFGRTSSGSSSISTSSMKSQASQRASTPMPGSGSRSSLWKQHKEPKLDSSPENLFQNNLMKRKYDKETIHVDLPETRNDPVHNPILKSSSSRVKKRTPIARGSQNRNAKDVAAVAALPDMVTNGSLMFPNNNDLKRKKKK